MFFLRIEQPSSVQNGDQIQPCRQKVVLERLRLEQPHQGAIVCGMSFCCANSRRSRLQDQARLIKGEIVDFEPLRPRRTPRQQKGWPSQKLGGRRLVQILLLASDHPFDAPACKGLSMIARRCSPRTKFTSVIPSSDRSLSSGTFIGPGDGAVPGAGCGNPVDIAVCCMI